MNKKIWSLAVLLLVGTLTAAACAGPAGSPGPAGPQGEAGPAGPMGEAVMSGIPEPYTHGIVVDIDGEDYYFDGPADAMNGGKDIPGHYWVQLDASNLQRLHYNTGPAMAPNWWSSDAGDGVLLYTVGAIIDTWTQDNAKSYAAMGYIHYHELVKVSDGSPHPSKIIWLRLPGTNKKGNRPELPISWSNWPISVA